MRYFKPIDIIIRDEGALGDASDILHDAVFLAGSWSHDETSRCFRLRLWREVPEVRRYERIFLCVSRVSLKRAACELTIRQVTRAVVRVRDRLDSYSLFSVRYAGDRDLLLFQTEGTISVEVSVERLDCTLFDTGETTWNQFGYSFLSCQRGRGRRNVGE